MGGVYDDTRTPEVLSGTITLVVLATIAVAARLYSRKISAAKFWWDDWLIIVAMILDIGLGTGYWLIVSKGRLGRHTVAYGGPVDDTTLVEFYKILLAIQLLYFSTALTIKTSLILMYFRIFRVIRWFRITLGAAWVIVFLYFIVDLLVAVFECKPVQFYWDQTIKGGSCINENQFYRWNGVANLLIDFMIWSLTMPVIWHLQLDVKQKLSLSAIFLLGLLACAASIVRVIAFDQVNLKDITWTLVSVATWTTIEQSIGIICACLATLRPLFVRLFSNIKQISTQSRDYYYRSEDGGTNSGSHNSRTAQQRPKSPNTDHHNQHIQLSDLGSLPQQKQRHHYHQHHQQPSYDSSLRNFKDMRRSGAAAGGFERLEDTNGGGEEIPTTTTPKSSSSKNLNLKNAVVTTNAQKTSDSEVPTLPKPTRGILMQKSVKQHVSQAEEGQSWDYDDGGGGGGIGRFV